MTYVMTVRLHVGTISMLRFPFNFPSVLLKICHDKSGQPCESRKCQRRGLDVAFRLTEDSCLAVKFRTIAICTFWCPFQGFLLSRMFFLST